MTPSWNERAQIARKACEQVWPKIVQLRAELHKWESVHGYFEIMRIDAERHLIQIIKLPPSATSKGFKKNTDALLDKVIRLSPEQKKKLILALEGRKR